MTFIAYNNDFRPALVVITGPRIKIKRAHVYTVLDALFPHPPDVKLISGRAKGADQFGEGWAASRGAALHLVAIDDALDGGDPYQAPKNRNQRMVDLNPFVCVGFPGHNGTNDMLNRCHKAGIVVWEVVLIDDLRFEVWQWPTATEPTTRMVSSGALSPF